MLEWITCVNCSHTQQVHRDISCSAYRCNCAQLVTIEEVKR